MAQVKDLLVKGQAKFLRKAYFQDQIVSNVAQGTAPLVVASSTVVSNLNSDYLDGYHASGLFTALSANSTLSITIGGTTLTSSINAATVDGKYISNYYTKSEADGRFVNVAGDTMSGHLTIKTASYRDQLTIYRNENNNNSVINFSNKDGFLGAIGFTGLGQPGMAEKPHIVLKDSSLHVLLHDGNYTSYLGYIGTTAVQASSAAQALSGITSINSRLSINAESDNTRLGFGGVHDVTFGEPGYAHRIYFFRPAYGSNGVTYTALIIQNASAAASPTFTTTHSFDYNGNAYHSGNIYLDTGDSDRFIQFRYNSNNYAGASWRLLSRGSGSGDTNYFDIETGGSNASNNTWYRVIRLTMDNRYVGIGTDLPTYKLHIAGDSYTTGWSRAANGFYVEGTGVHFTHQGNLGEIDMTSNNEFLWGSSTATLYFNYRGVSRGTTVNNYIWNAGSSTSWASHNMGNIWLNGSGVYLRLGPQNSSHAHYETTASVSHWFNKRVDVNGDIWRYNTNYGIASDGQFYAKAIYANRDGSSTYGGVSLYSTVDPITEYGIAFRGTGNYGKIGRVQGDWATYFTMDSSHNRGWIFRSGGTNYASVSARGEAYFNSVGTDNYIAYPSGGFFSSDGSKSGYIIITIPANYRSCTMMRFNVEIYNYSTGTSTTYTIGGYNYSDGNWYNVFAYANRQGTTGYGNLIVRFGHNGTNSIIWIGESNTSYSSPKVRITNVTLGHSTADYNTWATGWSVTIATTAPTNVSQTVTNPATNYYAQSVPWSGITGKPASKTIWGQTYINASGEPQNVNGLCSITAHGQTMTLGSQNGAWGHIETTAANFYFNKSLYVDGHVYSYSNASYDLGRSSNKWRYLYLYSRAYLDEWIQFSGNSGLYWPNSNSATQLYPNNVTTYGNILIHGSRNGYSGIQLNNSTNYMTVMDNGSDKGLYNESNDRWIYYYSRTNDKVGILTSSLTKRINLSGQTYISTNTWIGTTSGSEMLNVGGWVGTAGPTGWYSLSYGGGIYMSDSTYVRVYNGKRFYNSNTEQYAFYTAGGITVGTHLWGTSSAGTWLEGQRYDRAIINVTNSKRIVILASYKMDFFFTGKMGYNWCTW